MLEHITAIVVSWVVLAISKAGYAGVAGLMAVESACIPLPSEIIMPFAGYLVSTGRFTLIGAATAGAIGCNLGSTLAYVIGAYGGRAAVVRWGSYVLFGESELAAFERFFARYGSSTVLISRLLPVVRTFISLPAGIARMPFWRFQIYTFAGSWPWCYGLAYVGYRLGKRWNSDPQLRAAFHSMDGVIVLVTIAAAAFYVYHRLRARKR